MATSGGFWVAIRAKRNPPSRGKLSRKMSLMKSFSEQTTRRNRLMLELMARGGMRVGEVLKLTPDDVNGPEAGSKKSQKRQRKGNRLYSPEGG